MAQGDLVAALRALREHAARDPAAIGRLSDRCFLLMRFGAIEPARACVQDLIRRWPDKAGLNTDLAQIELYDAGAESALAKARSGKSVDRYFEAYVLLWLSRNDEALAILRAVSPQTFAEPAPKLYPPDIPRFMLAGATLLRSGATAQGRTRLLAVIAEVAERPVNPAAGSYAWWDVLAFELLGERERAVAALESGVGAGIFLDIKDLDISPLLVNLRSDPRYEKIIAPARERMAAQIAAAQAAGLL